MARFATQTGHSSPWSEPAHLRGLIQHLQSLTDDGLAPSDYWLAELQEALAHLTTWGQLPDCDRRLATDAYLRALSDLRYGKAFHQEAPPIWRSANVSSVDDPGPLVDQAIAGLDDMDRAFADARPHTDRYRNLRKGYARARTTLPDHWVGIPDGPTLATGDYGDRVARVRQRLQAQGYLPLPPRPDVMSRSFDDGLSLAVRHFQQRHSLAVDGKVGRRTLQQLNVSPQQRLQQIRANLERLRWLSRDMEKTLVLVDIAAARIEFYEDGERVWSGKAQVGRPKRATPELKSVITHVTVNPHWTMPRSIFLKDALPAIRRDPDYLRDRNIRILDRSGEERQQSEVDWNHPQGLTFRQDPGPGNALGRVAIRFSNPYAVYLHDTPAAGLFSSPNRFYSSGCVRVQGAMTLTRLLFRDASPERQREFDNALASGESHNVPLPHGVYILMAYWTAEADASGQITYRPDVYGSDRPLLALLDD
ncbi:L,D-transpeptidase family protein [Marinobacter halodurans]|nr:L,D-transpeptidase family protein [Marinobacter halodurans]